MIFLGRYTIIGMHCIFISAGERNAIEMEVRIMVTGMRGNGMAMEQQKLMSIPKEAQDVQTEIPQISIVNIYTIPTIFPMIKKKPG